MAQSVFQHRPARERASIDWRGMSRSLRRWWDRLVQVFRHDPQLFFWNLLWLPFWVASDAAPPQMPSRRMPAERQGFHDPAGIYLAARMDRVVRTFTLAWIAGAVLRGLTLAILGIALWSLLAVLGVGNLPAMPVIAAIAVAGIVLGLAYGWLIRPDRLMVAGMLDRTFGLEERIVTAFDRPGDDGHVSRLQLADAANTFEDTMSEIPRAAMVPIREIAACLIAVGALVTVLLSYVPHDGIAAAGESPVPQFVLASERLAVRENTIPDRPVDNAPTTQDAATIAEIQERGRESQSARDDLARIAEALRDHPITQPAAEAIANGDYAAAAEALRSASQAAGSMDQQSRDALADDLDQAADQIAETNPELAQSAQEAADDLRAGGTDAETALSELAEQVDQTSERVASQEDLARDLDEAQSGSNPSSGSEGSQGEQSSQEGNSGEQQTSDQGQASDPGEGSAAEPGVSNEGDAPSESQQPGSDASEGSSDQGAGSSSSQEGAGDKPSDMPQDGSSGQSSNDGASSEGDSSSSGANDQGLEGGTDDETSASQGSGAGTGQRGANDQTEGSQSVDDPSAPQEGNPEAEVPNQGKAGDPPPSRSERGEEDDNTGTTSQGDSNLEIEGTSDEGVQSGGDSGSSSLGSGTGSTTASGDQSQGDVGVAGPDSNRVPDTLRDVVKDYFGGPEE